MSTAVARIDEDQRAVSPGPRVAASDGMHDFESIATEELDCVTGGGELANLIGGFIDKVAGTNGKASQLAGHIGGIIDMFKGRGQQPSAGPQGGPPQGQ